MPEAVKRYLVTNSLTTVKKVHNDIVNSYLESLVKYNTRTNIESMEHLIKSVLSSVGSQIKYTRLDPDRRIEVTKVSLNILEKPKLYRLNQ